MLPISIKSELCLRNTNVKGSTQNNKAILTRREEICAYKTRLARHLIINIYTCINTLREYNREGTIKRNWQDNVHKIKKNKTKTQRNMLWTPLCANKHI